MIFHDSVLYRLEMKELKGKCVCPPPAQTLFPYLERNMLLYELKGDGKCRKKICRVKYGHYLGNFKDPKIQIKG